jgi:hypothetical protein
MKQCKKVLDLIKKHARVNSTIGAKTNLEKNIFDSTNTRIKKLEMLAEQQKGCTS